MKSWFKYLNLGSLGILSFLIFFIFAPLTLKIKLAEGVYVEPLFLFLFLSLGFLAWPYLRKGGISDLMVNLKDLLLQNRIIALFYLLMLVLFLSYFYGLALTGFPSTGDFLRLIKYSLYFLVFPLAIFAGRKLEARGVGKVMMLVVLVGVIMSFISLFRIYSFLVAGGEIDFWVYNPETRSTGMLAWYLDLSNFDVGIIAKAVHATFGLYLSAVLASCLSLFLQVKEFSKKWFLLLGAVGVIFAALLCTISRGALGTGIFVLLGWFAFLLKKRKFLIVAFVTIFLAVGSFAVVQLNPEVFRKFATTVEVSVSSDGQTSREDQSFDAKGSAPKVNVELDASFSGRIRIWKDIFNLFLSKPLVALFGVGYSTENLSRFTQGRVTYAHSLFMDMWVRGGIFALGLMLALWLYLFRSAWSFTFSKNYLIQIFGFTILGFLAGWFGDNLISGEQFFSDAPMLVFWGTFGLVYSLKLKENAS